MGLDLSALSHQVRLMSGSLATEASDTQQRTTLALGRYLEESADYGMWARRQIVGGIERLGHLRSAAAPG
jgi:hypothetical protein